MVACFTKRKVLKKVLRQDRNLHNLLWDIATD